MIARVPNQRRFFLPPTVLLAAAVASVTLHWLLPIDQLWERTNRWVGGAIIVAALSVNTFCALQFFRQGTTVIPFKESSALLTGGLYRFSRNPIYLTMVTVLIGEAIALGSLSPWLVPAVFALVVDRCFIRHEEVMLADTFGDQYLEYCRRVRRWL